MAFAALLFSEIDLPDGTYVGDFVMGGAHLKSGGDSSDRADRLEASQNVAYFIDYLYNGAGTGTPDPAGKITDSPAATTILGAYTPVVIAGDWNEDEASNGRRGPAAWLTEANSAGTTDGTDRDRSDMTYDAATHPFTGSRATFGSSSKLDYVAWQDSIATARHAFVFNSTGVSPTSLLPSELMGLAYPPGASGTASDHRPVVVDLILPVSGGDTGSCCNTSTSDCVDDVIQADCLGTNQEWTVGTLCSELDPVCGWAPTGACCINQSCIDDMSESACAEAGGLYKGDGTDCATVTCPVVAINEVRIDQPDSDYDEYFELAGDPGTSLDDLTYIVIGDGTVGAASGVIEAAINLTGLAIDADGYFLVGEGSLTLATPDYTTSLNFENSDNVTHMLVAGFTASTGVDVDTDDDGVFDIEPWSEVIDLVALIESENPPVDTEYHYGPPIAGPEGTNVPGHVYRCPNRTGGWQIGAFDPVDGDDTPGVGNVCPGDAGACCDRSTDTCVDFQLASECQGVDMEWTANTLCVVLDPPCIPPTGACCFPTYCADGLNEFDCAAGAGSFQGEDTTCAEVTCPPPPSIYINEVRIEQSDADSDEFFELAGDVGASLTGFAYIVIGDGTTAAASGVVEAVVSLSGFSIPASGYFVVAESTFTLGTADLYTSLGFENSDNVTHMLVISFAGALGDDLDTNDDGVLDITPWAEVVDKIALIEEANPPASTEYHYGPPTVGPDGDGVPPHVYRCATEPGGWGIGVNEIGLYDTPGAFNGCAVCGNGILEGNEACDDGNTADEDGCSSACLDEYCGDGITQAGLGETCDDGNTVDGDTCPASCVEGGGVPCPGGTVDCVLADNNCCLWDNCGGVTAGFCDPGVANMFGDVCGSDFPLPPNGAVNLTDVLCTLNAFGLGNLVNCPNADVAVVGEADCPAGNQVVNLTDILKVLDAFGAPGSPTALFFCACPSNP